MALGHLWVGSPCRRPSRSSLRHAGMALGTCGHGGRAKDKSEALFATPGWLWSTCGQGPRAKDRSEELFATQGWLWSTCGQGRRAEDRSEELFATQGWLWSTCGQGRRAEQIVRQIIMIEVKVLVGYAPWHMVSGGIGSRKGKGPTKWEGPPGTICHGAIMDRLFLRCRHRLPKRGTHAMGRPSRHHLSRSNHGPAISPA